MTTMNLMLMAGTVEDSEAFFIQRQQLEVLAKQHVACAAADSCQQHKTSSRKTIMNPSMLKIEPLPIAKHQSESSVEPELLSAGGGPLIHTSSCIATSN